MNIFELPFNLSHRPKFRHGTLRFHNYCFNFYNFSGISRFPLSLLKHLQNWRYVIIMSRESALYSCLNIKELLVRNSRDIWSLSDSNEIQIHNQLVRKRTLNYLAKLTKWLTCIVSFYLYGAFDCMLSSCHIHL